MKQKQRFVLVLLAGILLLQVFPVLAQKTEVQADGKRIFNTIAYMASDQFLGRKPISPEFFEVQDWAVKQYKAWGLEPAGENGGFYQDVPIERPFAITYGTPKLVVNGREFFPQYDDFRIDTQSKTSKKIKGTIVFSGYGISAPDKGLDEYQNLDVKGKIVLVLKGDPNNFTPARGWMTPRGETEEEKEEVKWEEESTDSTKIITAYNQGAAGILFFNPEPEQGGDFRRSRPQIKESPFERDFVVVSQISEEVFHWALWTDRQMSSRGFTTWMNQVRSDIKNKKARSFDTGLKTEITGFKKTLLKGKGFKDDKGRNIVAKITGTDPELKNQYVVMGAHFDHLGVTNGQIYNGAEDNASGSGVVMEVARLMKEHQIQPKRTVIFCLWTAEEMGLIGSRYWAENPTDNVTMDQLVTYINMDMVGLGDEIGAPGALNFPSIWEVMKRDQDQDVLDALKPREGGPGGSDHSAYIEKGIEALALMTGGAGGHPDYHDTGDDVQKLNPEILRKTCQFVLQATINLGNETTTPLLIANRQDLYDAMRWAIAVINPELKAERGWSILEIESAADLSKELLKKTKELREPRQGGDDMRARMRRYFGGRSSINTGIKGAGVFNHDVHLLPISKDLLGFGRLDIAGDDGVWFDKGLTEDGAEALKVMRKSSIVLHLIQPGKATLTAVLEETKKPFLVTGFKDLDDDLITQINEKKVVIGVDFDPNDVEGTAAGLEVHKAKFGDTDNLLLNVTTNEGLDDAKKSLFHLLMKKGWKKEEILAIGGAGVTRRSRGNLDVFGGGGGGFPRQ